MGEKVKELERKLNETNEVVTVLSIEHLKQPVLFQIMLTGLGQSTGRNLRVIGDLSGHLMSRVTDCAVGREAFHEANLWACILKILIGTRKITALV